MAGKVAITDVSQLPLVMTKPDIAKVLQTSIRTIDRMERAGVLPPSLIRHNEHDKKTHYRCTRDAFLTVLNGGTSRRGRR